MNANATTAINLAAKPAPLELAESAYEQAKLTGDWQTAAELLFKVRKKARKTTLRKAKPRYPFTIGVATFADGMVATMGFFSPEGKPIDWARAAHGDRRDHFQMGVSGLPRLHRHLACRCGAVRCGRVGESRYDLF